MKPKMHARHHLHALLRVVLAGLLASLLSPTATAQTILLEVADQSGGVLFQVLSDGSVHLPTGAAAGHVLTADGSGYGTWQAVSGGGGSSVSTDATLTGDGTAGSPLGVAVPLDLTGNSVDGQVRGEHTIGHFGYLGDEAYGAYGENANGNIGYLGSQFYGAYGQAGGALTWGALGEHDNGHYGYLGGNTIGVYGQHNNGTFGYFASIDYGAYGENNNGHFGYLGGTFGGAYGEHDNGNYGFVGGGLFGSYGRHNNNNLGYFGSSDYGAFGQHTTGNNGYFGSSDYGASGQHFNGNTGSLGSSTSGVTGIGSPYAGLFLNHVRITGNLHIDGTLSKAGGSFKIDHPLDPEGQYLSHSFVESPDMMNVYNGNVTTDARGEAVVELPAYFEVLNGDFRYQLTAIGGFAPLYIAEKISGNQFKIAGGTPGMEVSWQVTGIRQDRWANENRIVVEEDKPAIERGFYLHPRLYGQPAERSVEWARDPEGMRAMKERPAQIEAERQRREEQQQQNGQERQRMQAEREQMKTERERMKTERKRVQIEREQRPQPRRSGRQ